MNGFSVTQNQQNKSPNIDALTLPKIESMSPFALVLADKELEDLELVPGLSELLESLAMVRPGTVAAKTYYKSKILEAATLLLDWWLLKQRYSEKSIRPADHTAINVTLKYIQDNLEQNITLKKLCQVSCMSTSKLTSLFKQTKHSSPIEYAREAKMDYARHLLVEDSASIQEISSRLGFKHQGSFSEAFKNRFGVTPRFYRSTYALQQSYSGTSTQAKPPDDLLISMDREQDP